MNRNIICEHAILLLSCALSLNNIPHSIEELYDGGKITFPNSDGDVVCHSGSYGGAMGLFETMGFSWDEDSVTGYLPLGEVVRLIEKELK